MARVASLNGPSELKPASNPDDVCPVCKSSRYMNPNMQFMINPECYHKMCESCVNRIFVRGSAPCPIAGCKYTLRRNRFRKPTFDDIRMEREVDIRKRIADVFNKREDEFEDLRAYNDYLNDVEDLTFNLIYGIEVEESERKLEAYKRKNEEEIERNRDIKARERQYFEARQLEEKEQARIRRAAELHEEEEEKRERAQDRQGIINKLATNQGDAAKIAREAQRDAQRKAEARRAAANKVSGTSTTGFVIRGLKRKDEPQDELPFDPYQGFSSEKEYFTQQDQYMLEEEPGIDWLKGAREDTAIVVGGYSLKEYYYRALTDAFSGLGVFVADEVAKRAGEETEAQPNAAAQLSAATTTSSRTSDANTAMEDVFT